MPRTALLSHLMVQPWPVLHPDVFGHVEQIGQARALVAAARGVADGIDATRRVHLHGVSARVVVLEPSRVARTLRGTLYRNRRQE